MMYRKIDNSDALLLVRSMGLLLNQAAVYGPVHNVTKSAISRVYQELLENLNRYGAIEFTVKNNLICLNGQSGDIDLAVSASLVRRLSQLDISGLLFTHPLPAKEFEKCIKVLAMPIARIIEASGVAELFKQEGLQSVAVVNIDYQRVDKAHKLSDESDMFDLDTPSGFSEQKRESGVIDLSESLLKFDELSFDIFKDPSQEAELAQRQLERQRKSAELATLLRETAEALESSSTESPNLQLDKVMGALEKVKASLKVMTEGSEKAISSLAQKVDDDKMIVASIEAEARSQGHALKLTREELLTRFAELNQEIAQPLTVSTAVIEMLRKEQVGVVNEAQQELLQMAQESIERVNQLAVFISSITGLPSALNPDMNFIKESYSPI